MPALQFKERLNDNLSIGVQIGKGTKGTGYKDKDGTARWVGRGVWTCEIKFPGERAIYKTTKVKYEPESESSKQTAMREAYHIFSGYSDRYGRGLDVSSVNYVTRLLDIYLTHVEEDTATNERLIKDGFAPQKKMYGGWSFWTQRTSEYAEQMVRLYIRPFAKERLPRMKREAAARIENIKKRDWDELDSYVASKHPQLTIETRLKIITECRKFLNWCYQEQYIDDVPAIARPQRMGKKGARERMRKEITEETYMRIVDYTRDRYLDEEKSEFHRDYAFLFHCYILIMANTGIRPPSGRTEHTLIKWEHIHLPENEGDKPYLERPKEKTAPPYEAMIMQRGVRYIRWLKEFYEARGIKCKKGFLFRHPHNTYYGPNSPKKGEIKIKKGDKLASFRTQWVNMCQKLDLHEFGTKEHPVPQSERISPSSLRAFYITQRLYADKNMRIDLLAEHTGTSIDQIQKRYARMDMAKSYDYLSAGGYDDGETDEIIYVDGFPAGHKNSRYWKDKDLPNNAEVRTPKHG